METFDIKLPSHNWHRGAEVETWVTENFVEGTWEGSNKIVSPTTFQAHSLIYRFQRKEDATFFALKWL